MGDMSPLSMLSDDECDEDGDITMSNVREGAREAIDSQDDLDMSQGMGHMSLGEGQDRRDGSTSPDPLALNDSTKDVSRYSPKPDPTTLFDEDEQTLRGPSDGQSSTVYEIHDDEGQAKSGGVPAAQFYGTAPQKKAVRTYQQAKSEKAKGKQRAAPDATSDDVEVQDGIAEPELLRSDQTLIITFDSLGSQHRSAINQLNAYLGLEARDKKQVENVSDVKGKMASVPVQPNFCDCGVYLIHFFRTFLSDPESFLRTICADRKRNRSDHNERKRAWREHEVGTLRQELRDIIRKESEDYKVAKAQKEREKEEAKKKKAEDAVESDSSGSEIDIVEVSGPPPSASKAKTGSQGGGRKAAPRSKR
ncbi:hypothetical protein K523DRAFT_336513 [Schizophyllum commune Tattone D]|nr:hypothetical protein K523DRAFT_336513 [Schizophyllum commune Tattone D]